MQEFQEVMARLRFLLAEIKGREEQLESMVRQFRQQLQRTPGNTIRGRLPLDAALAVMGEVQERLDQAERTLHHLRTIKERAQREMEALQLTHAIQQAQEELTSLQATGAQGDTTLQEIRRLETLINDYSQQAARSITLRRLSDS